MEGWRSRLREKREVEEECEEERVNEMEGEKDKSAKGRER